MQAVLEDSRHQGNPVTWSLAGAMLTVSISTLIWPRLDTVFGGIGEIRHPWQVFSSAFEHGWPGFPLLVHLILNLLLMSSAAVMAERLLGSARFLILTVAAILFYWLARAILYPLQANGASVFIWSYAPILLAAVLETKRQGGPFGEPFRRATNLLFIMWVVVSIAMAAFLWLGGVPVGKALFYGNVFHLSASVAGFLGLLLWGRHIRRRVREAMFTQSRMDRALAVASISIPASMGLILILSLAGWI